MTGAVKVEVAGVDETIRGLDRTGGALRPDAVAMRAAAAAGAQRLAESLRTAAGQAAPPQARLVAETVKASADGVAIGGSQPVGHRGTPARELVIGSEHGGRNFSAPKSSGGYWIAPGRDRAAKGATRDAIQAGVNTAIAEGGF